MNNRSIFSVSIRLAIATIASALLITSCSRDQKAKEPTAEERLAIFQSVPQETLGKTRWDDSSTTISNESRLDLYYPEVSKVNGGVYAGVGVTQNYTLAAWAKSQFVFLMDFTEIAVLCNRIHIVLLKEAATKEAYLDLWKKENDQQAATIIKKYFENSVEVAGQDNKSASAASYTNAQTGKALPDNYGVKLPKTPLERMLKVYRVSRTQFTRYVKDGSAAADKFGYKLYFQDDAMYGHLHALAKEGRMRAVKGNLLKETTLMAIGSAAKKMKLPVGILYTSNAEEYNIFNPFPKQFRENILNLPAGKNSLLVRSFSFRQAKYPWAPGSKMLALRGFHYSIQPLKNFQKWLEVPNTAIRPMYLAHYQPEKSMSGYTYFKFPPPTIKGVAGQTKGPSTKDKSEPKTQ